MASCATSKCAGNASEPCGAGNILLVYKTNCRTAPSNTTAPLNGDVFATSSALLERQAASTGYTVHVATLGLVYTKRPFRWVQDMYEASFERVQVRKTPAVTLQAQQAVLISISHCVCRTASDAG
jgi:hypothetical protein